MRTLVLGLGNPLLRDDSVGLRVVRALRPALEGMPDLEIAEDYHGGLRLMERLVGYDRAIIVDAIRSGAPVGTCHLLSPLDMPTRHSASSHDVDLTTALDLGRYSGAHLPRNEDVLLVAVEVADVETFGEDLTPGVEAAIPEAAWTVQMLLAGTPGQSRASADE
jgi:hydrogenase maturation protease